MFFSIVDKKCPLCRAGGVFLRKIWDGILGLWARNGDVVILDLAIQRVKAHLPVIIRLT